MAAATVVSSKMCAPVGDAAVGGEDDRAVFVAAADDLEQVRGGFAGHGQVAEFVDDQQLGARSRSALWSPSGPRSRPWRCERRGRRRWCSRRGSRPRRPCGRARWRASSCQRRAARSQEIGFLFDEPQRREVLDHAAIEGGLGAEVELLDRLAGGQLGEAQSPLQAPLRGRVDFGFEQVGKEPGVAGLVAFGVLERGRESVGDGVQASGRRGALASCW